jgi:hypothetical protein
VLVRAEADANLGLEEEIDVDPDCQVSVSEFTMEGSSDHKRGSGEYKSG